MESKLVHTAVGDECRRVRSEFQHGRQPHLPKLHLSAPAILLYVQLGNPAADHPDGANLTAKNNSDNHNNSHIENNSPIITSIRSNMYVSAEAQNLPKRRRTNQTDLFDLLHEVATTLYTADLLTRLVNARLHTGAALVAPEARRFVLARRQSHVHYRLT